MHAPVSRRTLLTAAAFMAVAGPVWAQQRDVHGTVTFQSGKAIPKGHIHIHFEDPSKQGKIRRSEAETHIVSGGGDRTVSFSLAWPTSLPASLTLHIVARLERDDGWLLARGSTQVKEDAPVSITLNTAMY